MEFVSKIAEMPFSGFSSNSVVQIICLLNLTNAINSDEYLCAVSVTNFGGGGGGGAIIAPKVWQFVTI